VRNGGRLYWEPRYTMDCSASEGEGGRDVGGGGGGEKEEDK